MDQLSKDSVAAQKAGMSYGKYMAMKERLAPKKEIKAKPVPKVPENWQTCPWCGKAFKKRSRSAQKYCEPYCQQEAQKERQRQRLLQKKAGAFL